MSFTITGASTDDQGPAGCVARFMLAGAASDNAAAGAELHPESLAQVSGDVGSPPGVVAADIGEPEDHGDCVWVPTRLIGSQDGEEQRFVFVVHHLDDDRWGIHLEQTLSATFGGDPMEMMTEALKSAVAPIGEALDQVGDAFSHAFSGNSSDDGEAAVIPRRIAADAALEAGDAALPSMVAAEVYELDWQRKVRCEDGERQVSNTLEVRVRFDLDRSWSTSSCLGVTLTTALSLEGADLRPADASPYFGRENFASWERERRDFYCRLQLDIPNHSFTGLSALAGVVRFDLTGGELLEIALGPIGDLIGNEVTLAALNCALGLARDEEGRLVVRMPSGWSERIQECRIITSDGEAFSEDWNSTGDGVTDLRTYSLDIPDDAGFVIRFWSQQGHAEIPFTAAGLPLDFAPAAG